MDAGFERAGSGLIGVRLEVHIHFGIGQPVVQDVVAQILNEPHERLILEVGVNLGLIALHDWRIAVVLTHEYARVFDKCERRCDEVVDSARHLAMGLASSLSVSDRHQSNALIGIVHATRDFDQLLGIHPKDIERESTLVRAIYVVHTP